MKSLINSAVSILFLAAISLAVVQPAKAAIDSNSEMIVLHVEGAPFTRGQVIDGNSPLVLEKGWSVTLASSEGSFFTLTGPSNSIPAAMKVGRANNHMIIETLSALLRAEKNSTAVLGVVRSAAGNPEDEPGVAWATSIERSGTRCVKSDVTLLWRRNFKDTAKLSIKRNNSASFATTVWPAGQEYLSVMSSAFQDGESYVFSMGSHSVELKMRIIPSVHTSPVAQAAWMTRAGCRSQAVTLIETIR